MCVNCALGSVNTSPNLTESTKTQHCCVSFCLAIRMGPRRTIEKKTGSSSRSNGIRFASVFPGVLVVVHQCPAGAARETAHETDVAKIKFCRNAIAAEYDFAKPAVISEQAVSAIEWSLKKTACEAACAREKIICQIEQIAHIMWSSGEAQQWLEECADEAVKRIAASVNGPLLLRLARLIGYHDTACVDLLRHGEHVHHRLPSSFAFVYFMFRRPAAWSSALQQQRHPYRRAASH